MCTRDSFNKTRFERCRPYRSYRMLFPHLRILNATRRVCMCVSIRVHRMVQKHAETAENVFKCSVVELWPPRSPVLHQLDFYVGTLQVLCAAAVCGNGRTVAEGRRGCHFVLSRMFLIVWVVDETRAAFLCAARARGWCRDIR
jgi:hypothetical protein